MLSGVVAKVGVRQGSSGFFASKHPKNQRRHPDKLSGPLIDRIDLHVEVNAVSPDELLQAPAGEATDAVCARATAGRARAIARQGTSNQALQGADIDTHCALDEPARKFLNTAATRLGWSARATHRALKVARTIADLAGAKNVQVTHVAEAVQYRALKALS